MPKLQREACDPCLLLAAAFRSVSEFRSFPQPRKSEFRPVWPCLDFSLIFMNPSPPAERQASVTYSMRSRSKKLSKCKTICTKVENTINICQKILRSERLSKYEKILLYNVKIAFIGEWNAWTLAKLLSDIECGKRALGTNCLEWFQLGPFQTKSC